MGKKMIEIIGIDIVKKTNDEIEHKIVSKSVFENYEEAGRHIDSGHINGLVFIGLPTYLE